MVGLAPLLSSAAPAFTGKHREASRGLHEAAGVSHESRGRRLDLALTAAGSVVPGSIVAWERPSSRREAKALRADLLNVDALDLAEVGRADPASVESFSTTHGGEQPHTALPTSFIRREASRTQDVQQAGKPDGEHSAKSKRKGWGWDKAPKSLHPEKDCKWGAWKKWGACSTTCGAGVRSRTREVIRKAKGPGLKCHPEDGMEKDSNCNVNQKCPERTCTADVCSRGLLPKPNLDKIGCGAGITTCIATTCCDKPCASFKCTAHYKAKANSDKLACKNDCDVATCCDEKTVPKETVEGDVGEAVKETEDVASKAEGAVEKILR